MSTESELRAQLDAQQLVIENQRQIIKELLLEQEKIREEFIVQQEKLREEFIAQQEKLREEYNAQREEHNAQQEKLREEHKAQREEFIVQQEKLREEHKTQREKDRGMVMHNLKALYKIHEQDMNRAYTTACTPTKKISASSNIKFSESMHWIEAAIRATDNELVKKVLKNQFNIEKEKELKRQNSEFNFNKGSAQYIEKKVKTNRKRNFIDEVVVHDTDIQDVIDKTRENVEASGQVRLMQKKIFFCLIISVITRIAH